LLHKGNWTNADVSLCSQDHDQWVEKGFNDKPFLIRWTIGIVLTQWELFISTRLKGLAGIPLGYARKSLCTLTYNYMDGVVLGSRTLDHDLPVDYFTACEKLLHAMHEKGVVHLDLRRGTNWIVQPDGSPGIIDFQSALLVNLLPKRLKNFLFSIDYSGLYKMWNKKCVQALDPERQKIIHRINRLRRLWIFSITQM
jgi:RIO-like serine/threonine protein kinase